MGKEVRKSVTLWRIAFVYCVFRRNVQSPDVGNHRCHSTTRNTVPASRKRNRLQPALVVLGVGDFFLRGDSDDQQDVSLLLPGQVGRQDVVDQVLALHGVHDGGSASR